MAEVIALKPDEQGRFGTTQGGLVLQATNKNGKPEGVLMKGSRPSEKRVRGKDGYIKVIAVDEPAFHYMDGVGALTLEEYAENKLDKTEDFTDSYWSDLRLNITKGGVDMYGNEGNSNILTPTTEVSSHRLSKNITPLLNQDYLISIFAKEGNGYRYCQLSCGGSSLSGAGGSGPDVDTIVDLRDGSIVLAGNSIKTEDWGNGIYRISIKVTTDADGGSLIPYFGVISNSQEESFAGDGVSNIQAFGFNCIADDKLTSYIKDATIRFADEGYRSIDISKYINNEDIVLRVKSRAFSEGGGNKRFELNDNSTNNRVSIVYFGAGTEVVIEIRANNTSIVNVAVNIGSHTELNDMVFVVRSGNIKFFNNGVKKRQQSDIFQFNNLVSRVMFSSSTGAETFYSNTEIFEVMTYQEALNQGLTYIND